MVTNGINWGTALMNDPQASNDADHSDDLPPVAYPHYIVRDDRATGEKSLSATFFETNPSHLIGRRTGNDVWPDDSQDPDAVALYEAAQHALYEEKDVVKAIRSYEAALDRDSGYVKAWVALAIAYISDNTADSLAKAEETLTYLAGVEPSDWWTAEASGIVYQNRAYLYVHRYRLGGGSDPALLLKADSDYRVADERTPRDRMRLELLCPWAYVKLEMGDSAAARVLWDRAYRFAESKGTLHRLREYAAKYVPLRRFLGN